MANQDKDNMAKIPNKQNIPKGNDVMDAKDGQLKSKDKDKPQMSTDNPSGKDNPAPEEEQQTNYTEDKLFYCIMPCSKGKVAIFTFPKECSITGTIMIMRLIPYTTKHLNRDDTQIRFGWSTLRREDGLIWRWCE
jgi:hypothetical protein